MASSSSPGLRRPEGGLKGSSGTTQKPLSKQLLDEAGLSTAPTHSAKMDRCMPAFKLTPTAEAESGAKKFTSDDGKDEDPGMLNVTKQASVASSAATLEKRGSTFGQLVEEVASPSTLLPHRRRRMGSGIHASGDAFANQATPSQERGSSPEQRTPQFTDPFAQNFNYIPHTRLGSTDGLSPRQGSRESNASGSPLARRRTTVRQKDGSGFDKGVRLYSPAETDDPLVPPQGQIFTNDQPFGSPGPTTRKRSTALWTSPVGSVVISPTCEQEDEFGAFGATHTENDDDASSSVESPVGRPTGFPCINTLSSREATPRASPALGAMNISMGEQADVESGSDDTEVSTNTRPQTKQLLLPTHDEEEVDIDEVIQNCIDHNSTSLELYEMHLTVVPDGVFAYCDHITSLDLSNNELTAIPPEIGHLEHLSRLTLKSNSITSLPDEIGQCDRLTHLYLDQNQLTHLPDSFGQLALLEVLGLDWNELQGYPSACLKLPNLKRLYIVENPDIALPPVDAWAGCSEHTVSLDNRPAFITHVKELKASSCCPVKFEWNAIYPDKIVENVYLGSLRSAQDPRIYQELSIEYLATIGRELTVVLSDTMRHIQCNVDDLEKSDLTQIFDTAHTFIDEAVSNSKTVLVHCFKGQSRSATIVITWLMKTKRLTRDEAYALVKAQRPMIDPNKGFMRLMLRYEEQLKEQWAAETS
eukprot:TRINITY_DN27606_c0_g1_i1.p1 TRINITY_DN27606_c0_g1~~TRINITY_DN27606_c0_g1_i1.p1  ORF type:complete len:701 (+),score=145.98 TRINITY_DN27606_c0_g1_i1:90-2192(+)